MDKLTIDSISYEKAKEYFSHRKIIVIPIGSIEQHGPANPLGTDMLIADALAKEVSRRIGVISLPVIPVGISHHHMDFPGTLTVKEDSLINYLFDIISSLKRWEVEKVLIVNGHGGNLPALQILCRKAREELGVKVYVYQWWTTSSHIVSELFSEEERGHAGAAETSLIMYLYPQLVSKEKLLNEEPKQALNKNLITFKFTREETSSGVYGLQITASTERGRILFEKLLEDLVNILAQLERE